MLWISFEKGSKMKEERIAEIKDLLKLNKSYLNQHYAYIEKSMGVEFTQHIKDAIRNIIMIETNYRELHTEKSKLQLQLASQRYRDKKKND